MQRAISQLREAINAELDATLGAYYELRASLSSEQWAALFPARPTTTSSP